jgi:hypothetical protein
MALPQSVLSELLDAFRAGEGVDLIRDAVQLVLQELEPANRSAPAVTSAATPGSLNATGPGPGC